MGVFRFRQFEVRNEKSAMKVNTDGVLLGALMTLLPGDRRLLDIGTGTGAIALMAAQRLDGMAVRNLAGTVAGSQSGKTSEAPAHSQPAPSQSESLPESRYGCPGGSASGDLAGSSSGGQSGCLSESSYGRRTETRPESGPEVLPFSIDAIDIDGASAEEAALNFAGSPWAGHLHAHHCPLSQFRPSAGYDLIFSNPPFFTETLHSPSARKAQARHADSLPLDEIFGFAAGHLTESGRISLILPSGQESEAAGLAERAGFRQLRSVDIRSTGRKNAYRTITEFSRDAGREAPAAREMVTINMNGKYSDQYLDIVSDFLLLGRP